MENEFSDYSIRKNKKGIATQYINQVSNLKTKNILNFRNNSTQDESNGKFNSKTINSRTFHNIRSLMSANSNYSNLVANLSVNKNKEENFSLRRNKEDTNVINHADRQRIKQSLTKQSQNLLERLEDNFKNSKNLNNSVKKVEKKYSKNIMNMTDIKQMIETKSYLNKIPKKAKYSFMNAKEIEKNIKNLKIKNHGTTKSGNICKNVIKGTSTVYFRQNTDSNNMLKNLLEIKVDIAGKSFKKSIKMKNIKWLLTSKLAYVELLMNSYKDFKWFLNPRECRMNKAEFAEFMSLLISSKKFIKNDKELIDVIFLLFDEAKTGIVDYKDIVIYFILFNDEPYYKKIERLIDISMINSKTSIVNLNEFLKLLKNFILNKNDVKKFPEIVKALTKDMKLFEISKNELYIELINNEDIKNFLNRNEKNAIVLEKMFDEEIVSISNANMKKSKMHFNSEIRSTCEHDYQVFERILSIRNQYVMDRKNNNKYFMVDNDSVSEDDK